MVTKDRRQRSIRFLIGLCVSLAMLQWAFTWKVPTGPAPPTQPADDDITFHVLEETPRTVHQRAKAKTIPSSARPVVASVVNIVDDPALLDVEPDLFDPSDLDPDAFTPPAEGEEEDDFGIEDLVFTDAVDVNPSFPGDLNAWLESRIRYPRAAIENGVSGTVTVVFVIDKDGKLTNARVTRGMGWGLDEEVLRVLRQSPDWLPGFLAGKPVAVQHSKEFRFVLGH